MMRHYASLDSDIYRLDDNAGARIGSAGWNNRELPMMNENNRRRSKRHRAKAQAAKWPHQEVLSRPDESSKSSVRTVTPTSTS